MGRLGRKRKLRARFRGGRLKPKPKELDERTRLARSQPHRRTLRSHDRLSEMAGSALGRLTLRGVVSAADRAAGESFAVIVGAYRAVIEGPRPVRSLMPATAPERADSEDHQVARFCCPSAHADPIERDIRVGSQILHAREWPCQQAGFMCACAERSLRYRRIYEAVAGAGRAAIQAVNRVAVRDEEPASAEEIVNLIRGLQAAARHLGLTARERAP